MIAAASPRPADSWLRAKGTLAGMACMIGMICMMFHHIGKRTNFLKGRSIMQIMHIMHPLRAFSL